MRFVHTAHGDDATTDLPQGEGSGRVLPRWCLSAQSQRSEQSGRAGPECGDWLIVRRGRTRFPRRPLESGRFLIGSGTNCHLQLGGGLPILHCLLLRAEEGWAIEAVAPEPPLLVNGIRCRHHTLRAGDAIQIADFEFVIESQDSTKPSAEADDQVQKGLAPSVSVPQPMTQFSVSELRIRHEPFDVVGSADEDCLLGSVLVRAIARHKTPATLPFRSPSDRTSPGIEQRCSVAGSPRRAA